MKRIISLFLTFVLVAGLITGVPVTVTAANVDDLTFELNENRKSYSVIDCNTDASGDLIIPEMYNGLPVTSIGEEAFKRCANITTISFPASIAYIDTWAFYGCSSLVAFNVDEKNGNYISVDGILFNKDKTTIERFPLGKIDTSYEIPYGVTVIMDEAFEGCVNLKSVTIPDSVTDLGVSCFGSCTGLESIVIPGSVINTSEHEFYRCYNLKKVIISEGLKSMSWNMFGYCTNLESIALPKSIKSIYEAMGGCSNLKYIFYAGNETEWANVSVKGDGAWEIENAIVHYNSTDHTYGDWSGISVPDCVNDGLKSRTCSVCDYVATETIPALGHILGDWIIDSEPTCTENGSKHKDCTICGETVETTAIPAMDHTEVKDAAVAATCTKTGLTEGSHCSVCNAVIKAQETVPAIGHNASEWIIDKNANCTENGSKHIECTVCGETLETSEILATGHTEVKDAAVDATCTETGLTEGSHCSVCNATINAQETVAARGHTSSDWKTDTEATVYKSGSKHKECTVCGEILETAKISQLKCSKPKLSKIENTEDGVKITWGKVSGADKYEVYRKTGSSGKYSKIGTTSKTYYTDKKASSGKKYYYYVKAVNEAGSSEASSSLSKYYLADTTLSTPKSTKSGITLKWKKITGADGYMVYRKTGSGSYSKIATVKGNSKVTYTDKKAKKGKTYTYKVKAYKSKTYSAYSNAKKIKDKY